jgi:hypothetical protein
MVDPIIDATRIAHPARIPRFLKGWSIAIERVMKSGRHDRCQETAPILLPLPLRGGGRHWRISTESSRSFGVSGRPGRGFAIDASVIALYLRGRGLRPLP